MVSSAAATLPLLQLLPLDAGISTEGHLTLGGCDAVALAAEFGTPLYVYDVQTIREQSAAYRTAFGHEHPDSVVLYGSKAFLNRPFAKLIAEQGLGFDAVSGGEIAVPARCRGRDGKRLFSTATTRAPTSYGSQWRPALGAS